MFKFYINKAVKKAKNLSQTIQVDMNKKVNTFSNKSHDYFKYNRSNNNMHKQDSTQKQNNNHSQSFFSLFIQKTVNYFTSFKNKLLIENKSESKLSTKREFDSEVIIHQIKTAVVKIANSVISLVKRVNFTAIVKVSKDYFPVIIEKANKNLIIVREFCITTKNKSLIFLEKHKNKELNSNFRNFIKKLNSSIESKSKDIKPIRSYFNTNLSKYTIFQKIKSKAGAFDMYTILTTNANKMNNILKSDGFSKKAYIYKTNIESFIKNKFKFYSKYEKIKFLAISSLALMVLLTLSSYVFSYYRKRRDDKKLERAFLLVEEIRKQNSELVRNNEQLKLLLQREKDVYNNYDNREYLEKSRRL